PPGRRAGPRQEPPRPRAGGSTCVRTSPSPARSGLRSRCASSAGARMRRIAWAVLLGASVLARSGAARVAEPADATTADSLAARPDGAAAVDSASAGPLRLREPVALTGDARHPP